MVRENSFRPVACKEWNVNETMTSWLDALNAIYNALRSMKKWVVAMIRRPTSLKAGHMVLFSACNWKVQQGTPVAVIEWRKKVKRQSSYSQEKHILLLFIMTGHKCGVCDSTQACSRCNTEKCFFLRQHVISTIRVLYKDDEWVGLIIKPSSHSVSDWVSKQN